MDEARWSASRHDLSRASVLPNTQPRRPAAERYLFGPSQRFEFQPDEHRLLIDGQAAPLGRRALDLLRVLAERPDRLISKTDLLDLVWPGLVVEEANLQMQISKLRKVLGGEVITTVPGRGYRFTAAVSKVSGAPAAPPSPPDTAPAPASATPARPAVRGSRLIGRDADLARVERLLQPGGSLSLVGPSGVGKTSLARAVAAGWPGRCVWVDLAALTGGHQVAGAIARALGLQLTGGDDEAPDQLLAALRHETLLLVLDNAEHLIQVCAELASLLRPVAGVQLLVTSQAPLAVAGERVLRLEPLALPGPGHDPDRPEEEGALALLLERISAADHHFTPTPAALPALRALCVQLDGLPLALEMAAARVPLLGLQGVHDALAQRFALLTRGHRDAAARHRTLHNALDWSYRLLGAADQRLFRSLGVFTGGFTLDLAVALMTDDPQARWDVIDGLATLADRSLIVVSHDDPPRYRLLETMRAFALDQLALAPAAPDEADAVRRRHVAAVLALFSRATADNPALLALCIAEMENARDALAWAREHELALATALSIRVVTLTTFTVWRHESGNWFLALEPRMNEPAGQALPAELQANWWTERGRIGAIRREANASVAGRRAVALWRQLGQPRKLLFATLVWVRSVAVAGQELDDACAELESQVAATADLAPTERLHVAGALCRAAVTRGDHQAALMLHQQQFDLARELGKHDMQDAIESSIVSTLHILDRNAEAAERGQSLLARVDADGSGTNGNLPWVLGALMAAWVALGRLGEARALLPRLFTAARRFATPTLSLQFCALAVAERRFGAAALLVGYARQGYESRSMQFEPEEQDLIERVRCAACAELGAGPVEALERQGRSLGDADAESLTKDETSGEILAPNQRTRT
ncbi:ATP-binding protein [Roseateles sp. LYH14W]|uniref:ATP-binding protein n=1 Tax=Pelomonas parva TaxID=3299032 RepID=A0ABW7FDZ0_9BURK